MAAVWFINPSRRAPLEPPSALSLLKYEIIEAHAEKIVLKQLTGLVIIDARQDLGAARQFCQKLLSAPQSCPGILLVNSAALSVLSPDWGAQDFILEDAGPGEFDARIRWLLASAPEQSHIVAGPVVIDEDAYTVMAGGHQLNLTYTEFELLKCLVLHPDRVLTREFLLSEVWGYDYYGGTRTVDVHIRRLRAKLGVEYDSCITTVRNVGYRFSPNH